MRVFWDASVDGAHQAAIQAAVDACTFPLATLAVQWTVYVRANPGHSGRNEALTTVHPDGTVQTEFAPGLFIPGDPLYVDASFVEECVAHELGHVVTLSRLTVTQQAGFGSMLGFAYPAQWITSDWVQSGAEAVAETFKDLFMAPAHRHFLNRTVFQLTQDREADFVALLGEALGSPTVVHVIGQTGTTTAAVTAKYGSAAWLADIAPACTPGLGNGGITPAFPWEDSLVDGLYSAIFEGFMQLDNDWSDVTVFEAHVPLAAKDIADLPDLASDIHVITGIPWTGGHAASPGSTGNAVKPEMVYVPALPDDYSTSHLTWSPFPAGSGHPHMLLSVDGTPVLDTVLSADGTPIVEPATRVYPDLPMMVFEADGTPVADTVEPTRILTVDNLAAVPGGKVARQPDSGDNVGVGDLVTVHQAFDLGSTEPTNGYLLMVWAMRGRDLTLGDMTVTATYTTGIAAGEVPVPPWPYPVPSAPPGVPGTIATLSQASGLALGPRRRVGG